MKTTSWWILGYFIICVLFFIFSFTQVDLSLTLSQSSLLQTAQRYLQYVGYFQRPLATTLFVGFTILLFGFYLFFLRCAQKNILSRKQVWFLIITTTVLLMFSYNAFSYDIFNYIFDAKIITHYQQNPYEHKALDYPSDPMLSFMRWTHRNYPYGPTWLLLTVPLSYLGLNYFLLTFFLFKTLMAAAFLGTAYFIEKIVKKLHPGREVLSLALFALNPFIIIESIVSGHHDIVMMFFAVSATYFFIRKKYIVWFFLFVFSVGIKFATIFLLPVFVGVFFLARRKTLINWEHICKYFAILMVIAIVLSSLRTELQPWYLLWVLPFVVLLKQQRYILALVIGGSLGALLSYAPWLYQGDWNGNVIPMKFAIFSFIPLFSLVFVFLFKGKDSTKK